MSDPTTQLGSQLVSQKGLRPTPEWLTAFLSTQRPTTPLQSLVQTAHFRFLASDITTSLSRDGCLPTDVANPHFKERNLEREIVVQVLAVEDISKSRWEQIEAIEAIERGEGTRGREIIRVVATEDGGGTQDGVQKVGGVHKLLLQDAVGTMVHGLELKPVEGVGLGMSIGCKMTLRDVGVARGMVLLEPNSVAIMGGKIEGMHKAWKEGRKAELRKGIEEQKR
ncbi:MAG: hypothetical protein Q9217_003246 [Psora testacea]